MKKSRLTLPQWVFLVELGDGPTRPRGSDWVVARMLRKKGLAKIGSVSTGGTRYEITREGRKVLETGELP